MPGTRSIHELSPQIAFNDFDGRGQTVAALSYGYSRCTGNGLNRWFAQASVAHVDEPGFSANAILIGAGLELHPLRNAPNFVISPVVRLGREDFRPGGGNMIYNAAVTISDVMPLRFQERTIDGTSVRIAATQFEWAARAEYTNRSPFGTPLALPDNDALTFFGSAGVDTAIGHSDWRSKFSLSYQTVAGGPVDGFASLGLSFRHVNPSYTNYDWNFAISGQLGDSGFRGVVLTVSRRF